MSLTANICMMGSIASLMQKLINSSAETKNIVALLTVGLIALAMRFICALAASRIEYLSSKAVRSTLREAI